MRSRAVGARSRLTIAALACTALVASSLVVHRAGAGTGGAPPTVTIDPTSAAPGSEVEVTAEFSAACKTANAVLTSPYLSDNQPVGLSGFFGVSAGETRTTTLTVPEDALAGGGYQATVACLVPPGAEASAELSVTGDTTPQATIQVSPADGPPGTQIDVALALSPADVCPTGPVGVALRTQEQIDAGSGFVDVDLPEPDPSGLTHGGLQVSEFPAGTVLFVSGGCISPWIQSPTQTFVVTGPEPPPSPDWWKSLRFRFDAALNSVRLLLIGNGALLTLAPTVTTTTRPRSAPTTAPPPPPPPPPPSSEPSTTLPPSSTTSTTEETSTTATTANTMGRGAG
jgi:hypothetical protein